MAKTNKVLLIISQTKNTEEVASSAEESASVPDDDWEAKLPEAYMMSEKHQANMKKIFHDQFDDMEGSYSMYFTQLTNVDDEAVTDNELVINN